MTGPAATPAVGLRVRLLDSHYARTMGLIDARGTVVAGPEEGVLTVEPDLPLFLSGLPFEFMYPKVGGVEVVEG
ncbi:hypothetical protein GBA65_22135 (plasmid) [Rubrobacter marinus]|uniref:Uncharacterized protein n=1 Tax=Rubrobacter marinus TaxID=2653852 RepID=A0A6G8Q3V2_9ACTN|nr:hypothetical protein [Rubrobacter marinus]QIN81135.1 hypothetical protein GBA65_22135 [Rubrobacter marinus]